MLKLNTKAPDFEAQDQDGKRHRLTDYLGKWVILYFYPKDNTPGCTKEACNFRDSYHELQNMGVVIFGVSKDSAQSHIKFSQKHNLNFPLLIDEDKKIINSYFAWGVKKFMGREFEGVKRMTYLINPKGEIVKIYEKVNPIKHVGEIIKDLNKFNVS